MDCRSVTTLITEYLSGAFGSHTRAGWEEHVHDCADCVAFAQTYRRSLDALRALPPKEISPGACSRIRRFLLTRIAHASPGG